LTTASVVLGLDPRDDCEPEFLAGVPSLVSRTFFCRSEKKLSMAALFPAEATRPIDPSRPLFFKIRITFLDRN